MIGALRRRGFIAGMGGASLPYDAEIEYLESNGNQYIETGIIPDADTGMSIHVVNSNTNTAFMAGLRNSSGNTRWGFVYDGGYYVEYNTDNHLSIRGVEASVQLNWLNDGKGRGITQSEQKEINLPSLSFVPLFNIRLFGAAGMTGQIYSWSGKMTMAKISQGSRVIMDLIPVRVGQTGYMYDKVSGQLFGNDGTGDFTLGNDKT